MRRYAQLLENGKSRLKCLLYFKYKIHVLSLHFLALVFYLHLFEGDFKSKYIYNTSSRTDIVSGAYVTS